MNYAHNISTMPLYEIFTMVKRLLFCGLHNKTKEQQLDVEMKENT